MSGQSTQDQQILIVDDEPAAVASLTRILRHAGYGQVSGCSVPREAPDIVIETRPALLILDLGMPGMDGFAVMRAVHERLPEAARPVVLVLSAHAERATRLHALQAGARDFIIKPYDAEEALLRVENLLVMQGARRQAEEASRLKSRFVAHVSHELRTPLSSVIGYARGLASGRLSDGERQAAADAILRGSEHLKDLIGDILDFSRIEAGALQVNPTQTDLLGLLQPVLTMARQLARDKGLTLELTIVPPWPRRLRTDPTRARQVLLNLLGNAIKFTAHGRVWLQVQWSPTDNLLRCEVGDTGIGIAADRLEAIFRPFEQAGPGIDPRYAGTGLGLTIARQLAQALGGTLVVRSRPGEGAVFTASIATGEVPQTERCRHLPREPWPPPSDRPPAALAAARLHGRVLLAEDDADLRQLLTLELQRLGLAVEAVADGQAAVDAAQQASFHAVLMDLQMPVLDGLDATRMLRLTGLAEPIIALSAHVDAETRHRALDAGCNEILAKPVAPDRLHATLAHLLGNGPDPAEAPLPIEDDPRYATLREDFLDALSDRIGALRRAYDSHHDRELASLAHQLKGVAGSFGRPDITRLAGELEDLARQPDPHDGSRGAQILAALEDD